MPPGIIFIFAALAFYSVAVWSEKLTKRLLLWMVIVFSMGFICDLFGTGMMFLIAEERFSFSLHSIAGYAALLIMLLHLLWALLAFRRPVYAKHFNKYSVIAWVIWLVAFVSGMPRTQ